MRTLRLIGTLLIFVLVAGMVHAEFQLDVKEFKLDNGLTVLILENHTAPVVSYYTFFKVGARNERRDNSGISHFFEHMMFNGAKKYGPKMFDEMLEAQGGRNNAYTSQNVTAYYEDFPTEALDLVMDLESDRMANLALEPEKLKSEAGVVGEERMVSVDNENQGIMEEELNATAFMAHSYEGPVVGWMESIKHFNRPDCVEYFKTYYAPNNAVVAIVGDINAEKTMSMMKKYFGTIPSGPPPPPVPRYEPEQRGAKRVFLEREAEHDHIMRGYHIGDKDSPDRYALEVTQFILTTGESSRMNQALVNDLQLALELYGGFEWSFDPSLFTFYIAVAPGKGYQETEKAFDSVLTSFAASGPTEAELQKAKNGLTANFYKGLKTNNGTAHELARHETLYGDWKTIYQFVPGVNAVTADQVKDVMAKYFKPKNSTTVILVPEGGKS
ncbi:MAG TPA: pitrilysin family protein [Candidatus Acidoferrum sp.]|nr:pitrilysin family protein [Candidatus Acidoferrum sp.]